MTLDAHLCRTSCPRLVIGAGPIGLAAAAHLLERGQDPLVVERGPQAAASVRAWGHVRLFSRWSELVDPAAARLLAPTGWDAPPTPTATRPAPSGPSSTSSRSPTPWATGCATAPPSPASRAAVATGSSTPAAPSSPSPCTCGRPTAASDRLQARAVVDASGTFTSPNPLGSDGYPAAGEHSESEHVTYLVPDIDDSA